MKVAVVLNAGAGSVCEEQTQRVKDAFRAAGVDADVFPTEGAKLAERARELAKSGVDAVVAAGGDGSVSAVASALVGSDTPLAVLPLGTLNHFAHDIGMPDDLAEAARAIATRRLERIDVGSINGQTFVNNSSIGLYPEMVLHREEERRRTGKSKWWAMVVAAGRVLKRFPLLAVRLVTPKGTLVSAAPFVFVGNNEYEVNALNLGKRLRLDRGRLSLYMVRCRGRLHMFWLMVRALLQRLEAVRDFEFQTVGELEVKLHKRHLKVSVDGEVVTLGSPLHYRVLAGALPVRLPPAVAQTAVADEETAA